MPENKELKKIYLAIPYSQIDRESSFKQANRAAALLLNQGYNVFSPISHCHVIAEKYDLPGTWEFWKQIDFQFIDWADEIYVLIPEEGFKPIANSVGVKAEMKYAKKTGKLVKYIRVENNNILNIEI